MLKTQNFESPAASPDTAEAVPHGQAPHSDSVHSPHPSHPVTSQVSRPQSCTSLIPQSNHSSHPQLPLAQRPLPLSALALLLGCTRSTVRHFADRFGFRYTIRRLGPRGQRLACLTPEQAQSIANELQHETSSSSSSSSSPSNQGDNEATPSAEPNNPSIQQSNKAAEGLFYLLQLEPERDPGRFKLGFSSDLDSRLDDLLTVVPLARLIAAWPAQRSWERIAIISTAQNAEPLSQEVFRIERLEDAVAAADRFFAVMPKLDPSPVISERLAHASPAPQFASPPSPPTPPEAPPSDFRSSPIDTVESPPPESVRPPHQLAAHSSIPYTRPAPVAPSPPSSAILPAGHAPP